MGAKVGKITVTVVEGMKEGDHVRDTMVQGFGCRRQRSEAVTYFVQKRVKGKLVRITIGKHGSPWTPETARKEAGALITKIIAGTDPRIERKQKAQESRLFKDAADDFVKVYVPKLKPKTRRSYKDTIEQRLKPAFGKKRVAEITMKDVERQHSKWNEHPRAANLALAILSRILTWAGVGENPCAEVKRFREVKRERYLTSDEVKRLGMAIHTLQEKEGLTVFGAAALRLLVLTGARTGEIIGLTWNMVDLERGLLILPDSKTGQKTIVLNSAAIEVLESIPRMEGNKHVIVGHVEGQPLYDLKKQWVRVKKEANINDIRVHDLRHSFASVAVGSGGSLPVLGKVLGHADSRTTERYAHLEESPVRELVETTGARFQELMGSPPALTENGVTKLRRVEGRKVKKGIDP